MRSSRFLLFTALLFATAVQAEPRDEPKVSEEVVSPLAAAYPPPPESRLPDLGGDRDWGSRFSTTPRGGARYGTGYEARQGLGARGERGHGR